MQALSKLCKQAIYCDEETENTKFHADVSHLYSEKHDNVNLDWFAVSHLLTAHKLTMRMSRHTLVYFGANYILSVLLALIQIVGGLSTDTE